MPQVLLYDCSGPFLRVLGRRLLRAFRGLSQSTSFSETPVAIRLAECVRHKHFLQALLDPRS